LDSEYLLPENASFYGYHPNVIVNYSGAVLFCAATAYLVYSTVRWRSPFFFAAVAGSISWYFSRIKLLRPLTADVVESAGFVARAISSSNPSSVSPFLIQYFTIM
jgi:hypothetical protein